MQIELLLPLSEENEELVNRALNPGFYHDRNKVVSPSHNYPFRVIQEFFLFLSPMKWLNDEIISGFLAVLFQGKANCLAFGSLFLTKATDLSDNHGAVNCKIFDYQRVKSWGCKVPEQSVFSLEHFFLPINIQQMHWTMAYVNFPSRRIFYYDSMRGDGKNFQELLLVYLKAEFDEVFKEVPEKKFITSDWKVVPCIMTKGPEQRDGYNCGVYICFIAELLANFSVPPEVLFGDSVAIGKEEANRYRRQMVASIVLGSVPPMVSIPLTFG